MGFLHSAATVVGVAAGLRALCVISACGATTNATSTSNDAAVDDAMPRDAGPEDDVFDDAGLGADEGVETGDPIAMEIDCGVPADASVPEGTLASGQPHASSLAIDDTNVYWFNIGTPGMGLRNALIPSTGGQVMKCSKAGCGNAPTRLVGGLEGYPQSNPPLAVGPWGVAFEDFAKGTVTCGLAGCDAGIVVSPTYAFDLAADATNLYWAGDYQIVQVPIAGGAATTLYRGGGEAAGIAVDGTDLYFVTVQGTVMKCAIGGCSAPSTLVAGPSGGGSLAVDATTVYWAVDDGSLGQILSCPKAGCAAPTVVVAGRVGLTKIATDGADVYFTESGTLASPPPSGAGGVYRCPVAGCRASPAIVAGSQTNPIGIAVDDTRIYWASDTCGGASVLSATK